MRLAFDAKRAFCNGTGLGSYSRILLSSFFKEYPGHDYFLITPKNKGLFDLPSAANIHVVEPQGNAKLFSALWRRKLVVKDLNRLHIDLYHGLSNEMPAGIQYTDIRSVVTIHDLIFERYPKQYNPIDVQIYRRKFKSASKHADKVVAISKQTRQDLIDFYRVPEEKITVCYQSCDAMYAEQQTEEHKLAIKKKYGLPEHFFLYLGSVIERKNLLLICKAMYELGARMDIPLVVIGKGRAYMQQVKHYIKEHNLQQRLIFLSEHPQAKTEGFRTSLDFPAIYQLSRGLIYPSIFEGFGLPVMEAMVSGVPVITSNTSCLPETGGDAAYYIDPFSAESLAETMIQVAHDETLRADMIQKGFAHAQNFTQEKCAASVMEVYKSLVS
jgi:glycosyltransferase involved in cell wall biosynthesis